MSYLWYFLFGYVIIEIEMLGVERLLNAAMQEGLKFLSMQRKSYTSFLCKNFASGLPKAAKNSAAERPS